MKKVVNILIDDLLLVASEGSLEFYKHKNLSPSESAKRVPYEGAVTSSSIKAFLNHKYHYGLKDLAIIGELNKTEIKWFIPKDIIEFKNVKNGKITRSGVTLPKTIISNNLNLTTTMATKKKVATKKATTTTAPAKKAVTTVSKSETSAPVKARTSTTLATPKVKAEPKAKIEKVELIIEREKSEEKKGNGNPGKYDYVVYKDKVELGRWVDQMHLAHEFAKNYKVGENQKVIVRIPHITNKAKKK